MDYKKKHENNNILAKEENVKRRKLQKSARNDTDKKVKKKTKKSKSQEDQESHEDHRCAVQTRSWRRKI